MRSGKLLAEQSPDALLSMYQAQTLEEVFLKLSQKQEQGTSESPKPIEAQNERFTKTLTTNGDIELEFNNAKNVSIKNCYFFTLIHNKLLRFTICVQEYRFLSKI